MLRERGGKKTLRLSLPLILYGRRCHSISSLLYGEKPCLPVPEALPATATKGKCGKRRGGGDVTLCVLRVNTMESCNRKTTNTVTKPTEELAQGIRKNSPAGGLTRKQENKTFH